jgi:hypothetical protein
VDGCHLQKEKNTERSRDEAARFEAEDFSSTTFRRKNLDADDRRSDTANSACQLPLHETALPDIGQNYQGGGS